MCVSIQRCELWRVIRVQPVPFGYSLYHHVRVEPSSDCDFQPFALSHAERGCKMRAVCVVFVLEFARFLRTAIL